MVNSGLLLVNGRLWVRIKVSGVVMSGIKGLGYEQFPGSFHTCGRNRDDASPEARTDGGRRKLGREVDTGMLVVLLVGVPALGLTTWSGLTWSGD